MISVLSKVKHLTVLAEPLLKSEAVGFNFCNSTFQRTLYTKNILLSRSIYKKELNETEPHISESEPTFGKVIELGEDFDEVRVDLPKRRRGRGKSLNENFQENSNDNITAKSNEENFEIQEKQKQTLKKEKEPGKISEKNEKQEETKEKKKKEEGYNLETSKNGKFKFQTLSKNSSILSSAMTNLKSRKVREKKQQIILEGKRLIHDAISAGCIPLKIFFSRESDLETLNLPEKVKLYRTPYKSLQLWGDVITSQGVMGVFEMPSATIKANEDSTLPLTIICDNVRDPGNLGSMLRVIAGVGCEKMILTKGCVDIWEPKVLRAGAGAHFHVPVKNNINWDNIEKEIDKDSEVLLADFSHKSLFSQTSENENKTETEISSFEKRSEFSKSLPIHCYYSFNFEKKSTVIVIGGETQGLSDEAYKFASERKGSRIFIPMSNKVESLNNSVTLGILAYEFKRQFDYLNGIGIHSCAINNNS